jgi:hypothetical protein
MERFVSIKEVPDWLKDSEIYTSLDKEENIFVIPCNKYENEIIITNINELYKYLEICRYWMVYNCPWEIYEYVIHHKDGIDFKNLKNTFFDLFIIHELEILVMDENVNKYKFVDFNIDENKMIIQNAVKYGYLNLLKFLLIIN